jgi:hypothetical protein
VENNVLELRTRADAERAAIDPIQARDALNRLHAVESDFRRHVESVVATESAVPAPRPCAKLLLAEDPAEPPSAESLSSEPSEEMQPEVEDGVESEPQ